MLRDSVAVVVRTCPQAILVPMITMRKSIHGFLFPYMVMGLRLAALRATRVPLLGSLPMMPWQVRKKKTESDIHF